MIENIARGFIATAFALFVLVALIALGSHGVRCLALGAGVLACIAHFLAQNDATPAARLAADLINLAGMVLAIGAVLVFASS
jgi:uncharacterized membrane protein